MDLFTYKWDIITYCCGGVTLFLALIMVVIVVVRKNKQSRCIQKSIPHCMKNKLTKTKTALYSKGDGCVSSFCRRKAEFEDEGYVSEHNVIDTEKYTPVGSTIRAGEESNHELIVEVHKTPVSDHDVVHSPEEREATVVLKDGKASSGTKKKRKRSKRKLHHHTPVMETQIPGQSELCLDSLNGRPSANRQKACIPTQCRDGDTTCITIQSTNMPACFV